MDPDGNRAQTYMYIEEHKKAASSVNLQLPSHGLTTTMSTHL